MYIHTLTSSRFIMQYTNFQSSLCLLLPLDINQFLFFIRLLLLILSIFTTKLPCGNNLSFVNTSWPFGSYLKNAFLFCIKSFIKPKTISTDIFCADPIPSLINQENIYSSAANVILLRMHTFVLLTGCAHLIRYVASVSLFLIYHVQCVSCYVTPWKHTPRMR